MDSKLEDFESIGAHYAEILRKKAKIRSIDRFIEYSIEDIHEKTQIDIERLKEWSDIFDLFRIPNLSPREAELLYHAEINSVFELAHRQAIRIFYKLRQIDDETRYVILQLPTFAKIQQWIHYAKLISRRIKFGENIPLILLPMINFHHAQQLKQYNIFTVEDLELKKAQIKNLRKKIGLSNRAYNFLEDFIKLLKVPGVDVYIARIFYESEFESVDEILDTDLDEIVSQVQKTQENEKNPLEIIPKESIMEIVTFLKEVYA